jgi:hypothetical protein
LDEKEMDAIYELMDSMDDRYDDSGYREDEGVSN